MYNPPDLTHLQLGDGLLLADLDLDALLAAADPCAALADAADDPTHALGMTACCTFQCLPEVIHTEAAGQRSPTAGTLIAGCVKATLSGTMFAITPANAARLSAVPVPAEGMPLSGTSGQLLAAMESLCWVGPLADGLLLIELRAPVSIGGLTLRPGSCGTGEMPFTFLAQQRDASDAALPYRLHWLKEASA